MVRRQARRAQKFRRCECGRSIQPGDFYVELAISPDHGDVGNVGWWRAAECEPCAATRGHDHLILNRSFDLPRLTAIAREVRAHG